MTAKILPALALCALGLALSACRLEGIGGNVGADCNNSSDCDDDTLACVSDNPDDPRARGVCMPPPAGWSCEGLFFNDFERLCDCGCGVVDADCANNTAAVCAEIHCEGGQTPLANNNAECG